MLRNFTSNHGTVSDDDSIGALLHDNKPMKNYSFENEIIVYGLFDRSSENEVLNSSIDLDANDSQINLTEVL